MAEYIEREALRKLMYEEAFEKDSDMQRWDSGCWIRYKLFENCIEAIPAADVVEVVRCRECKHYNAGFECLIEGYGIERPADYFCADGERKDGGPDDD